MPDNAARFRRNPRRCKRQRVDGGRANERSIRWLSQRSTQNLSRWRMAAGNRTIAAGRAPVVQTGLPPMVWKNPVAYISTYETIYIKHLAFLRATHVGRVGNANPAGRRHRSRPK